MIVEMFFEDVFMCVSVSFGIEGSTRVERMAIDRIKEKIEVLYLNSF